MSFLNRFPLHCLLFVFCYTLIVHSWKKKALSDWCVVSSCRAGCSRETLSGRLAADVELWAAGHNETPKLQLRGSLSPHCCPLLSEECKWNRWPKNLCLSVLLFVGYRRIQQRIFREVFDDHMRVVWQAELYPSAAFRAESSYKIKKLKIQNLSQGRTRVSNRPWRQMGKPQLEATGNDGTRNWNEMKTWTQPASGSNLQ